MGHPLWAHEPCLLLPRCPGDLGGSIGCGEPAHHRAGPVPACATVSRQRGRRGEKGGRAGPGRFGQLTIDTTAKTFNLDQSSLAAINLNGLGRLEGVYTVLMSALGIGIFVFGLVLQRRKEHVTMRALWMRMHQLQTLVLGEAGAVTVLSLVIGTAVGVGMSVMFVQILTPLFTVPPQGLTLPLGPLGLLGLLVMVATALSSLAAGITLRRTPLVESLREE